MLSNLSNKNLLIVFAVLLAVVLFFFFSDSGKHERTFRENLVEIDTTAVTAIKIYPKTTQHKEVNLFKENNSWHVKLANGKTALVSDNRMKGLFDQLIAIKPKRLAAREQSKWNELQVDTTGTRVVVKEGSKETLDIVLGKFSFKQPRSMSTFVRLSEENDVYEVDGFLEMTFNQNANVFRDGTIIKDDYGNWSRLSFSYPADSSFQMSKQGDFWFLNGSKIDSSNAVDVLRQLANVSGSEYADDFKPAVPGYILTIDSEKLGEIKVEGFVEGENKYIRTSQNPETIINATKSNLFERVFIGQGKFIK